MPPGCLLVCSAARWLVSNMITSGPLALLLKVRLYMLLGGVQSLGLYCAAICLAAVLEPSVKSMYAINMRDSSGAFSHAADAPAGTTLW